MKILCLYVVSAGIIYLLALASVYMVNKWDFGQWGGMVQERRNLLFYSGCNGLVLVWICSAKNLALQESLLLAVLAGALLFACVSDCKTCEVYRFTWWIGGMASGLLLFRKVVLDLQVAEGLEQAGFGRDIIMYLLQLSGYLLLQEFFFCKFYGRADCHAFFVCAMAECALGMGLREYLFHMLLAFGGLAVIQMIQGNIDRRGNLKQPVAFLPYITFAFWSLLFV